MPAGSFAYTVPLMTGSVAVRGLPSPRHVAVGLSPTFPFSVVVPAELELVSPAPATATKVESDLRLTGRLQGFALVVKVQTLFAARTAPAASFAPAVIVAVFAVPAARLLDVRKYAGL